MTTHPGTPFPDSVCNASPAFTGRGFIDSLEAMGDPGLLHQKNALAGWIALIADDRGLGPNEIALTTEIDPEQAAAILGGTVMGVPLSVLDRTLRTLENRPN